MPASITQTTTSGQGHRGSTQLLFILLALITGSLLRVSLVLVYPFVVILILTHFRLKIMQQALVLGALAGISLLLSLIDGFYWQYNLLS